MYLSFREMKEKSDGFASQFSKDIGVLSITPERDRWVMRHPECDDDLRTALSLELLGY